MASNALGLYCPRCRASLEGSADCYQCRACGADYPVKGGIIRMLPDLSGAEEQVRSAFEFEHRRYRAARYLRISPKLIDAWLADVQLPREYFKGRTVLDVGCGSGRWTYAMASLGARVVSVDFTDAAVEVTREVTQGLENVDVIQASLFHLPFRAEQFDFIVMVYERRSPLKVVGTELLRMVLRRLSPEARYRACGRLVIKNRLLFQLLRGFVECIPLRKLSETLDAETAQFGLYDWYSPHYNHLHSVEEVQGWFRKAGFEDFRLTSPVKYTRPLDVLRFGECGGSIRLRGLRQAYHTSQEDCAMPIVGATTGERT